MPRDHLAEYVVSLREWQLRYEAALEKLSIARWEMNERWEDVTTAMTQMERWSKRICDELIAPKTDDIEVAS